jgi:hypothetical protein
MLVPTANYVGRRVTLLDSHAWEKVRIGLRFCTSDSGGNINPASLRVGLSVGASFHGMAAPNPVHAANFSISGTSATWTRSTAPTRYNSAFCAGEGWINGVLINGSVADIESGTGIYGAGDSNRTLLFCEFTKGTPSWSMRYFRNQGGAVTDVSAATFAAQVRLDDPVLVDHAWNTGSTMPVSEATNGYFTHAFVSWTGASCTIKISDFAVEIMR